MRAIRLQERGSAARESGAMQDLSYATGASDVSLIGETLGANFDRIAATFPENEAVVACHQNQRLTYRELREVTDTFARGLIALGVKHGDRVGIWSTNSLEWVVAQFATPKIGAILVNVNPAYRSSEAAYALAPERRLGASNASPPQDERVRRNPARDSRRVARTCERRLARRRGAAGAFGGRAALRRCASARRRMSRAERLRERSELVQFDEAINIQYTSGTTGFPKGATLSHHNILNNGFFIGEGCRYTERDRVCVPVPVLPLLRDGARQSRHRHARRDDRHSELQLRRRN